MFAEITIIDNRAVSLEKATRLLSEAGDRLDPSEVAALVERLRREQPPGSRSYFARCEHGAYVATRRPGSTRPDSEGVRRALTGLREAYG